ncbi:MAG: hypothetical protein ACNA8W_20930 [Bradymonadaceae bacterium]
MYLRHHIATLIVTLVLVSSVFTGCRGELDPARADDSYLIFRDALFAGDSETMWNRSDAATHEHFQHRYTQLVAMDTLIERYLPLTDHRLARRQSGVELIDTIKDGKSLFIRIFDPAQVPQDEAILFGSDVREIQMSEDGKSAVIVTRGEQEFIMARSEEDNLWYVSLIESEDVLSAAFAWLDKNEAALEQTVEDLIAEERTKREAIIAELMGVE